MKTLFESALEHLSSRHCSERELRSLLEKDFATHSSLDEAINQVLEKLRELHLINDWRIAERLIQDYRHKGTRFIRNVLHQNNLPEELIEKALAECSDEYERALEVLRKQVYSTCRVPVEQSKPHLMSVLDGCGFSQDVIQRALQTLHEEGLMPEQEEHHD